MNQNSASFLFADRAVKIKYFEDTDTALLEFVGWVSVA